MKTELLATISLNDKQADLIRLRFHSINDLGEWDELAACFPTFKKALDLLPDTSGFRYCNVMLQEMVVDAIKELGYGRKR